MSTRGGRGRGNIQVPSPATPSPSPAGRGLEPTPRSTSAWMFPYPSGSLQQNPISNCTQPQPNDVSSTGSTALSSTTTAVPTPTWGSASRSGLVTVEVGATGRTYCLYEALLTHHSEYFRNALKGSWKEAKERKIRLEDVELVAFNIFVHWLHAQSLPARDLLAWQRVTEVDNATSGMNLLHLIKAYALGDRLLSLAFRRAINGAIVSDPFLRVVDTRNLGYVEMLQFAFAHVPAERPILQLLVEQFCLGWREDVDKRNDGLRTLPSDFVVRALRIFARNRFNNGGLASKRCYDEHQSDEEKTTCGKVHMDWDEQQECGYFR